MLEKDCSKLVQDGRQCPLKIYFLATRFTNLYHLSSDVARYERAKITKILAKLSTYKGPDYHEMTDISALQTNDLDFDLTNEELR